MSKEFKTSREICQASIDKVEGGVCPGCGGEVTPIETVDNSGDPTYWAGCNHCSVFTYPVPLRLFRTAQALIDEGEYRYDPKPYNASKKDLEYWRRNESNALCSRINRYVKAYEAAV